MVAMTPEVRFAVAVAVSIACGVLITWLILRSRISRAFEAGKALPAPELERLSAELARKDAALQESEKSRNSLNTQLAVAQQKNQEIPDLKNIIVERERRLDELNAAVQTAAAALATEKERTAQHLELVQRLAQREHAFEAMREQIAGKEARIAELATRREEERSRFEEQLALLQDARQQMTDQFTVLAQKILEEKSQAFGQQSQVGLKSLLDPLRDQIGEFRKRVDDVHVQETADRTSLRREIEALRDLNQQIGQEAVNLTRALKGDKKAQGTWGELVLERVLEKSGLRKGVEYETQGSFRDADGNLLRPDVVIHLPEDKCVVVDSKVSLVAYERYANAEDDPTRRQALAEHVAAVRAHIASLSSKDYANLKGMRSLDYILMFMPVDAAFVAAFRADEALYTHAFERKIVVVTPSTLLATLKTIEIIWRYERQNRSATDVFKRAGAIYDKLRLVVESIEKLGNQINTVQGTWAEVINRLVRGKGNVMSQLAKFSELGVPIKRTMPQAIMEQAEIEGQAAGDTIDGAEDVASG